MMTGIVAGLAVAGMAVNYSPGRPYVRAVSAVAAGTGNITPSLPSYADNDILLLFVQSGNETVTAPSGGWTAAPDSPQGIGTPGAAGASGISVFWLRASGTVSAPTVTDPGDHVAGFIASIAGCIDTGSPFAGSAGTTVGSSGTALSMPSVSPSVDRCLIVHAVGTSNNGSATNILNVAVANANLAEITRLNSSQFTNGNSGAIAAWAGFARNSGATGATTGTLNRTVDTQSLLTLALKPPVTKTPFLAGFSAVQAGSGALSVSPPPTHAQDDLLLLIVETANEAITTPSGGWAIAPSSPQGIGTAGSTGATRLSIFWKIASSSEGNVTVADSGDHQIARMVALGSVDVSNPFDVSAGDTASTSTSASFPSATTTGANRLILWSLSRDNDAIDGTVTLGSYGGASVPLIYELFDDNTQINNGGGIVAAIGEKYEAGSVGTMTATLSATGVQARITLAINPAP